MDMFWDNIKGCQKDEQRRKEEYEMHARSNESLRDKMDGVLEENPNAHSCESSTECCGNCKKE